MHHNHVDRLQRAFCTAVPLVLAALGLACIFWPPASAHLLPWALPPLHARCIGLMHLALALELTEARRQLDPAAARIPLASALAWSLATLAAFWPSRGQPAALAWLATACAVGGGAAALLWSGRGDAAPAQHADLAWLALAALALLLAASVLLAPAATAARWPWRTSAAQVAAYAPPFMAFGVAAALLAHERRRYARRPAVLALLTLGIGVVAASVAHHTAFEPARWATWVWFAAFSALSTVAARRLSAHQTP
jgi:hypothetical protein